VGTWKGATSCPSISSPLAARGAESEEGATRWAFAASASPATSELTSSSALSFSHGVGSLDEAEVVAVSLASAGVAWGMTSAFSSGSRASHKVQPGAVGGVW
jgi:hypothetical protein